MQISEQLSDMSSRFKTPSHERGVCNSAIEELRRLHAENEALKAKLTPLTPGQCVDIADLAAKLEFSDNFLSDICKIVELVEVAHGIVKP
jgi:hypothetical protein